MSSEPSYAPSLGAIKDESFQQTSKRDSTMESRNDNLSQAPTAVTTPMFAPSETLKKDEAERNAGAVLTATNTIDTLTLEGSEQEKKADQQSSDGNPDLARVSTVRKLLLLSMFTLAEFLDAFNNSALFPAIPIVTNELSFTSSEVVWIISAYQLTFAAFLLVSGRISDVYTPKPAFVAGSFLLGLTHLIGGFVNQKIALLVLRALGGIGGALTIPSALSLIVQLFPDPSHQARAISLFGSAGAIGNVLGILIGAVLVQYAGWPWIFWFVAIIGIGVAAVCFFLIPTAKRDRSKQVAFDVTGVSLLTTAVILFIFAVTSGSTEGWGTAYVLAPLIISLGVFGAFLYWESRIPPDDAVLPPRMWRYRNFSILVALALLPYLWWVTSFVNLTSWWQQVYGWSAISTAVHFLPMGIGAWLISNVTGRFPNWFPHKYILLAGLVLSIIATILLPFGDSPSRYWRFDFPAFTLGTIGMMVIYANSSIAIFSYTPPVVAGTVGAVFNSALQLGSAVGLAAVSSITTSLDEKTFHTLTPPIETWPADWSGVSQEMWKRAFEGRAASFWFLLGILGVETIAVIAFFKVDLPVHDEEKKEDVKRDLEALPEKN